MKEGFRQEKNRINLLPYLEQFTIPDQETHKEQKRLLEFYPSFQVDHGVVIGRFQPLHFGHLFLILWTAKFSKKFTIGIGSANIKNQDNPFTFQERTWMLLKALSREGLIDKLKNIVPLYDYPDDQLWLNETLNKIGKVNMVVGNNPWVNNVFNNNGILAVETPLLLRCKYEGRKIREELNRQGFFPSL